MGAHLQILQLFLRPGGLPRAADELELAPLHLFFERAKFRLLADVESLVDGLVGLPDLARGARIEIRQRSEPVPDLILVRRNG